MFLATIIQTGVAALDYRFVEHMRYFFFASLTMIALCLLVTVNFFRLERGSRGGMCPGSEKGYGVRFPDSANLLRFLRITQVIPGPVMIYNNLPVVQEEQAKSSNCKSYPYPILSLLRCF